MRKLKLYHVYCIVHRNCVEYVGMIYAKAYNAREAEEQLKSMFGYNDPHPFHVKAFRDDVITPELLAEYYQRPWILTAKWEWDVPTQKAVYRG